MNCTPKVGYPLQPTRVQFFMIQYTLHFKHQAVFHYLRIRSRQRTADHHGLFRIHLRRRITAYRKGGIRTLERPKQFEFKEAESCGIQNPAYANRLNWLL